MTSMWGSRGATARRARGLALAVVLVPALAGCSVLGLEEEETVLTGVAACALGHTWSADVTGIAAQVQEILTSDGVPVTSVTAEGSQTLEWGLRSEVVLKPEFTLTVTTSPGTDQVLTLVETHSGEATGAAYINGDTAIPRKWDGTGVRIDTVVELNGEIVEEPPFDLPPTSIDDSVGLLLTCSDTTLTIQPRGDKIVQTWRRTS